MIVLDCSIESFRFDSLSSFRNFLLFRLFYLLFCVYFFPVFGRQFQTIYGYYRIIFEFFFFFSYLNAPT